jgi:hypothetical protein
MAHFTWAIQGRKYHRTISFAFGKSLLTFQLHNHRLAILQRDGEIALA